jgi:hypothetical protein
MKSSLHSLIHILPFLPNYYTNCQLRRLSQFYSLLQLPSLLTYLRRPQPSTTCSLGTQLNSNSSCVRSSLYSIGAVTTENIAPSVIACWFTAVQMCLAHRCVATSAVRTTENTTLLLLRTFASAGMCLPSLWLAIKYSAFQASCHTIV